jgi:hypothetical protein
LGSLKPIWLHVQDVITAAAVTSIGTCGVGTATRAHSATAAQHFIVGYIIMPKRNGLFFIFAAPGETHDGDDKIRSA